MAFCDPNVAEHQSFIATQPLVKSAANKGQKKYAQENDDSAQAYAQENDDSVQAYAQENDD